jgi:hypothetical protein
MSLDDDTLSVPLQWKIQKAEAQAWGEPWTDSGLVFTPEDGSGLHPASVTDLFQAVSAHAGLPPSGSTICATPRRASRCRPECR